MSTDQGTYIIASKMPWHYFDLLYQMQNRFPDAEWIPAINPDDLNRVLSYDVDAIFFPHWSWIIPAEIYDSFPCVIFHMTDLPYGRGGSPLQNLIIRGHTETKLTALRCVKELDAGPIYCQRDLNLRGTAYQIMQRTVPLMADMITQIITEQPEPRPQTGEVVTFRRRRPEDSRLPGDGTTGEVYDWIRMLDCPGYPRAFIEYGGLRIEFSRPTVNYNGTSITVNAQITWPSEL